MFAVCAVIGTGGFFYGTFQIFLIILHIFKNLIIKFDNFV